MTTYNLEHCFAYKFVHYTTMSMPSFKNFIQMLELKKALWNTMVDLGLYK